MKKYIPNTITCCNLISGCIATFFAFQFEYKSALLFIVIGAVFDFFDGFAARLLHVSSPIGKELDSLADDITFGFAPAAIVFSALNELMITNSNVTVLPFIDTYILPYVPFSAFLIAAFSALRLAKFNLDERQTTSFVGMPTPANALFWAACCSSMSESNMMDSDLSLVIVLVLGIFLSCGLLVSELPMFALKFKNFKMSGDNILRYTFIVFSAIILLGTGILGICFVILLYLMMSIASNVIGMKIADKE